MLPRPFLLEFNKGPAMKPVNDLDARLKREMIEDVFRTSAILPNAGGARTGGFLPLGHWYPKSTTIDDDDAHAAHARPARGPHPSTSRAGAPRKKSHRWTPRVRTSEGV